MTIAPQAMALENHSRERLVSLNDPLLRPLIEARTDAGRRAAMEALLVEHASPTIRRVVARFAQSEGALQPADADDVASAVTLRLVRKLQACAEIEEEAIERLPDYVATQTFNAVYDLLRLRFPERMRLKSRVRYVLTHDPRLALWTSPAGPTAGLAPFRDGAPSGVEIPTRFTATRTMLDRERPGDALFELLTRLGAPVRLDMLVRGVAELWNVVDHAPVSVASVAVGDGRPNAHEQLESRESLGILWAGIRELRAPQRAALLLNLRDVEGTNGVVLFLLGGVATFAEIADAAGLDPAQLAQIWSDLPLDDQKIAGMLGLQRQQVINLRQAARDRLSRWMSRTRRRSGQ